MKYPYKGTENPTQATQASQGKEQGLDRKSEQLLLRGKVRPEATLDLHGLDRLQAQQRFLHFIKTQHSAGARTVLIITGKGEGILRGHIAGMLASPNLSHLVAFYGTAPRTMGGEGGFILRLRRKRS